MQKKIIILGGIVAVVVIAAIFLFLGNTPYNGYASAFNKLYNSGSMECNFTSKVTMDSTDTTATGNMKMTFDTKKFYYKMTANNSTITQFYDGTYIYQDNGTKKTKFKAGEKTQETKGEFDMQYYEQEFASLIEAGKIKSSGLIDKLNENIITSINKTASGSDKKYEITLANQITTKYLESLLNETSGTDKPTVKLNSFKYIATENASGFISSINYLIDCQITLPASLTKESAEKKLATKIDLKMDVVNPGTKAEVTLPDSSAYTQQ